MLTNWVQILSLYTCFVVFWLAFIPDCPGHVTYSVGQAKIPVTCLTGQVIIFFNQQADFSSSDRCWVTEAVFVLRFCFCDLFPGCHQTDCPNCHGLWLACQNNLANQSKASITKSRKNAQLSCLSLKSWQSKGRCLVSAWALQKEQWTKLLRGTKRERSARTVTKQSRGREVSFRVEERFSMGCFWWRHGSHVLRGKYNRFLFICFFHLPLITHSKSTGRVGPLLLFIMGFSRAERGEN